MDPSLLHYAWVGWIVLILLFGVVEIFTLDFIFLMFAVGGVGGLVVSLFDSPLWLQIIVAAVLSIALLFFVRPPLLRVLRAGGDETPSNVDALFGIAGTVTTAFTDGSGQAKLANGETWTARLSPSVGELPLVIGDRVRVVAIEGATAIVEPTERMPL